MKPGAYPSSRAKSPGNRPLLTSPINASNDVLPINDRLAAIEAKLESLPALEAKIGAMLDMMRVNGVGGKMSGSSNEKDTKPPKIELLKPDQASIAAIEAVKEQDSTREPSLSGYESEGSESEEEVKVAPKKVTTAADDEEEKRVTVLVESDEWMINPKNKYRMVWDLGVIMPLLVYLTIALPFRMCFENEAPCMTYMYFFEFGMDMLFIADIFLNFRTGYYLDEDAGGEDSQLVEFDRKRVAVNYLKSWFILDVVSGVPFALIELLISGGCGDSPLKSAKALKLLRFLKLGRLLKMEKILSSLDRDTLDVIEDFFQNGTTRSGVMMLKLLFYLAYAAHLMACGFVVMGKIGDSAGVENWLGYEIKGPFTSEDTTGINGDDAVYSIYIAAFYFCLTSMTSVGYGDVITRNNLERLYVITLEFLGAIIFATVIAAITSVVTSMDMNARKTAEELDAVASFVALRQFPTPLARKIRRHFRHFYSRKSAIDESKIFSELSTTLRKTVSSYLVNEILGEDSFFQRVNESLWPKMLPLLRPMSFEPHEEVCEQNKDATEMYVVISGTFIGELQLEGESDVRVRHILKGDSVNTLHVLGIWNRCIETVISESSGETYAISEQDFSSLYSSEADQKEFQKLRGRELRKFKSVASNDSPLGRTPLYYACFTCVEFSLVQVQGRFLANGSSKKATFDEQSEAKAWIVVDLVDIDTLKPFNEFWRHESGKRLPKPSSSDLAGTGELNFAEKGGEAKDDTEKDNDDRWIRWTDVNVNFEEATLRVRLFVKDSNGSDALVGTGYLSLDHVKNEAAKVIFGNMPKGGGGTADKSLLTARFESGSAEDAAFDTWIDLRQTNFQLADPLGGDKEGNEGSRGVSLDAPSGRRRRTGTATGTKDSDALIADKLHIRVKARPPEMKEKRKKKRRGLQGTASFKKKHVDLDSEDQTVFTGRGLELTAANL